MAAVYWIHLPSHADPTAEGYIGITSREVSDRFAEHLGCAKGGSPLTLYKALRKYHDIVRVTTLVLGSDGYCRHLEARLRPAPRIGWNIVAGGGKPPRHSKHTEEAKAKISAASRVTAQSPARKAASEARRGTKHAETSVAKMRERASGRLPWGNLPR